MLTDKLDRPTPVRHARPVLEEFVVEGYAFRYRSHFVDQKRLGEFVGPVAGKAQLSDEELKAMLCTANQHREAYSQ